MRLHNIPKIKGATHPKKRLGCGRGSGHGKTSGRGQKGSKSRSGYSTRQGFEGGQMPLFRKLPRRGFSNYRFQTHYEIVNLDDLNKLEGVEAIDREELIKLGLVRNNSALLKILGRGEISRAVKVTADKFSTTAKTKIEAAGGQAVIKTESAG